MKKILKKGIPILMIFATVLTSIGFQNIKAEEITPIPFREWRQNGGQGWDDYNYHDYGSVKAGTQKFPYNWRVMPYTIKEAGCYVVSYSIQIARAKASDDPNFNPLAFAKYNAEKGFMTHDGLMKDHVPNSKTDFSNVPYKENFYFDTYHWFGSWSWFKPKREINYNEIVEVIKARAYGEDGAFPIIHYAPSFDFDTHFIAVDRIDESGNLWVNDPAKGIVNFKDTFDTAMVGMYSIRFFKSNKTKFYDVAGDKGGTGVSSDSIKKINKDDEIKLRKKWDGKEIPGLNVYGSEYEVKKIKPGFDATGYELQQAKELVEDVKTSKELNQGTVHTNLVYYIYYIVYALMAALVLLLAIVIATPSNFYRNKIISKVTFGKLELKEYQELENSKEITLKHFIISVFVTLVVLALFVTGTLGKIFLEVIPNFITMIKNILPFK